MANKTFQGSSQDWQLVIDELAFDREHVQVRGWMIHPTLGESVIDVQTTLSENSVLPEKVRFGLSSPDVAGAVGSVGARARFESEHAIPSNLSVASFLDAHFRLELANGEKVQLPFSGDMEAPIVPPFTKPLGTSKVGLGITTYNRRDLLSATLDTVEQFSKLDLDIVVVDDGSTDGTQDMLRSRKGVTFIGGDNRGIAWNKNRALFYLAAIKRCDVVILLEDDVQPVRTGWDVEWALAAAAFGHVNYAAPWSSGMYGGTGRWHKPYRSAIVSGQCSAYTAEALAYVGYLDTRFGKYGHEHVEHTLRMIRAGYGGKQLVSGTRESYFLLINGGLHIQAADSHHDEESVKQNYAVLEGIWNESIYRPAWRTDDEFALFRSEILSAQTSPK